MVVPVGSLAEEALVRGKAKSHQRPHGVHSIDPCQLLSLVSAACVVVNRHLVNAVAESQDAGRDVRLDVESRAAEAKPLPQIRPEHLIARLHVGYVAVEQQVGGERHRLVSHHEPEAERCLPCKTASAVNRVGTTLLEGFEQGWIVTWVVLEIGVLYQRKWHSKLAHGPPQCGSLTLIGRLPERTHSLVAAAGAVQNLPGIVG